MSLFCVTIQSYPVFTALHTPETNSMVRGTYGRLLPAGCANTPYAATHVYALFTGLHTQHGCDRMPPSPVCKCVFPNAQDTCGTCP